MAAKGSASTAAASKVAQIDFIPGFMPRSGTLV
jgi:hypothetical protein